METVGANAFSGCYYLESLTLQEGLKTIGEGAFHDCRALTAVSIPASVETVGDNAFNDCYKLENLTLQEGLKTIGEGAFDACNSLRTVSIPGSVESIGNEAFSKNFVLLELEGQLPANASNAFSKCSTKHLMVICRRGSDVPAWAESMGFIWAYDDRVLRLPAGLKRISAEAFSNLACDAVILPDSCTAIEKRAFANCKNLIFVCNTKSVSEFEIDNLIANDGSFVGCGALQRLLLIINDLMYTFDIKSALN